MQREEEIDHRKRVPVWDLPTRLFHWFLVALIACAWLTNRYSSQLGGFHWHKITGYTILSLILFRMFWGYLGGSTSRFVNFVKPLAVFGYLRGLLTGNPPPYLGHNPVGTLMILALLCVVALQAVTGMFSANADSFVEGPFASMLSEDGAARALTVHQTVFSVILVLAALHILANLSYALFKRDGMITAMITGYKQAGAYVDAAYASFGSSLLALVLAVLAGGIVFGGVAYLGVGAFLP